MVSIERNVERPASTADAGVISRSTVGEPWQSLFWSAYITNIDLRRWQREIHVPKLLRIEFLRSQRCRRLLLCLWRVLSPVAHAHRVRVTAVARVAGYLLGAHGEDAGAGKI